MQHLKNEVGEVSDFRVRLFASRDFFDQSKATLEYFHQFPTHAKWTEEEGVLSPNDPDCDRNEILQAWLFFGLAFTVVQKEGRSLLSFDDLGDGNFVTTKKLPGKLAEWAQWEMSSDRDINSFRIRMIQLGIVLDRARRVVRKTCSYTTNYASAEASDKLNLSIMILGESLSEVRRNIMIRVDSRAPEFRHPLPVWVMDNDPGWGKPGWVVKRMKKDSWCIKIRDILEKQFGNQAILMLSAYISHQHNDGIKGETKHANCTQSVCKHFHHAKDSTKYVTAHHLECKGGQSCSLKGLDAENMTKVKNLLMSGDEQTFPLLRLDGEGEGLAVVVVDRASINPDQKYAAISHVWSDGYGNEETNEIWSCQLELIQRLLREATGTEGSLFWMDTLLIPVDRGKGADEQKKMKAIRKRAIAQIPTIFEHSECTIVLDRGLLSMDFSNTISEYCSTAMKILASGWTRRLWTLQEAYLSRKLKFAFQEDGKNIILEDFDELFKRIQTGGNVVHAVLPSMIQTQLSQSILRKNFSNTRERREKRVMLIDNSWRATRWRTTSNAAHETVALATLLELKILDKARGDEPETEKIANALWQWEWGKESGDAPKDKLQGLMCDFWTRVDRDFGAIPAGMIFLPGEKMKLKGFGWAPCTFLQPKEIEAPDPLSILNTKTRLDPRGLVVKCPGYFLYRHEESTCADKDGVRTTIVSKAPLAEFSFPIDSSFQEWYTVRPVENDSDPHSFARIAENPKSRLAIMVSRLSPAVSPPEIGLLVLIYNEDHENDRILYCQILFRVIISRTMNNQVPTLYKEIQKIFGEPINGDQKWCVDGYNPEHMKHKGSFASQNIPVKNKKPSGRWLPLWDSGNQGKAL